MWEKLNKVNKGVVQNPRAQTERGHTHPSVKDRGEGASAKPEKVAEWTVSLMEGVAFPRGRQAPRLVPPDLSYSPASPLPNPG